MKNRPLINIHLTPLDRLMEIGGWLVLMVMWVWVLLHYSSLPGTIPIHFDATGQADRFGDKVHLLIMPAVATLIVLALTALNQYPHLFNYPTPVTAENAQQQYTSATRFIRFIKLCIAVIFSIIVYKTIRVANGNAEGLGKWVLPLSITVMLIPLFFFIIHSARINKK